MVYDIQILNLANKKTSDLIYLSYRGSIVSGLYRKNASDVDFIGLFYPDSKSLIGLSGIRKCRIETTIDDVKFDGILYDIRDFFKLCLKANPTVLEPLFVPERFVIFTTIDGMELRKLAPHFISRKSFFAFNGYALSQFKRLKKSFTPKTAYSLLRIIDLGIGALQDGKLIVHDKAKIPFYKEVLKGSFKKEDIEKMAKFGLKRLKEVYSKSKLPDEPNYSFLEDKIFRLIERHYLLW